MTPQLRNLLILLCGIAVVLLLVVLLFGGNGPLTRFMSFFLEEDDSIPHTRNTGRSGSRPHRSGQRFKLPTNTASTDTAQPEDEAQPKNTSEPIVEMATLVQRSDDRLRVIENSGRIRMIDEYYELLFVNRKGRKLKIQCSPEIYEKIPFDVQGSLTYKRSTLVKFKLYDKTYFNDGRIEDSGNPVYSSASETGETSTTPDEQTSGS